MYNINKDPTGFTLLYAMLVVAAVIGVTAAVAGVLVRELKLSDTRQRSLEAYYAAQSGLECAYSWSLQRTPFDGSTDIECDGVTIANVGENFTIDGTFCADVTVTPGDPVSIVSKGYDTCSAARRQVERTVSIEHAELPPPAVAIAPPPVVAGSCTVNACTGPDGVTSDLACGLLRHYPLTAGTVDMLASGEEVRDMSVNALHGDLQNSAGTQDAAGGLVFDGINDIVNLGRIDLTGDFTITARVKSDTIDSLSRGIVAKRESYILKSWNPGVDQYVFKIRRDDTDPRYYEQAEQGALPGTWYTLAGRYNCATKRAELFVDGLLVDTSEQPADVRISTHDTLIGVFEANSGPDGYFDGVISNVRIYGRALNGFEITSL